MNEELNWIGSIDYKETWITDKKYRFEEGTSLYVLASSIYENIEGVASVEYNWGDDTPTDVYEYDPDIEIEENSGDHDYKLLSGVETEFLVGLTAYDEDDVSIYQTLMMPVSVYPPEEESGGGGGGGGSESGAPDNGDDLRSIMDKLKKMLGLDMLNMDEHLLITLIFLFSVIAFTLLVLGISIASFAWSIASSTAHLSMAIIGIIIHKIALVLQIIWILIQLMVIGAHAVVQALFPSDPAHVMYGPTNTGNLLHTLTTTIKELLFGTEALGNETETAGDIVKDTEDITFDVNEIAQKNVGIGGQMVQAEIIIADTIKKIAMAIFATEMAKFDLLKKVGKNIDSKMKQAEKKDKDGELVEPTKISKKAKKEMEKQDEAIKDIVDVKESNTMDSGFDPFASDAGGGMYA